MVCSTPIRKPMFELSLPLMVYVPLQLLHLPDFGEYLAHHALGLMIGSQDLVDGDLRVSSPSGLTLPA